MSASPNRRGIPIRHGGMLDEGQPKSVVAKTVGATRLTLYAHLDALTAATGSPERLGQREAVGGALAGVKGCVVSPAAVVICSAAMC
jgi:hypothetical protein